MSWLCKKIKGLSTTEVLSKIILLGVHSIVIWKYVGGQMLSDLRIFFLYLLIFNPVLALRRLFKLLCSVKLLLLFFQFQLLLQKSRYPPLMQESSWTLAAPFKEQHHYRNPSDSIANNYSLTARDLKLKNIKKLKSFSMIELSQASLRIHIWMCF